MTHVLLQDELAEQDGQQDTDGGTDEIQQMGLVELRIDDQVANAMGQLLDDDCRSTCHKTRRDAEYQHETTVGHVCRAPSVEAINPSVDSIFGLAQGYSLVLGR